MVGLGTRSGWSQNYLVAHFHVSQSTVSKLLRKARVHGYVDDHLGSGEPPVTDANDANDDDDIIDEIQDMCMPFKNSRMLQDQLHTHNKCQVSVQTILSLLQAPNIIA